MRKTKNIYDLKWKAIVPCYIVAWIILTMMTLFMNWAEALEDAGVKIAMQALTSALLLMSLGVYCYYGDTKSLQQARNTIVMFITMIMSYGIIWAASLWTTYGMYIVPIALCSLVLFLLVPGRSGFFANLVIVLLFFFQSVIWKNSVFDTEEYFYMLFGGFVEVVYASFVLGKDYRRLRYIVMGALLGVLAAVCVVIDHAIFSGAFTWEDFGIKAVCAFASGILGVMLMFVIVPVFERIFKTTSVFRFSEIANSDTELMLKLFELAPGTYNHSLTVASYVEACAMAIGQSTVVARACSYYHDIGKMKNPMYFSENQLSGVNLHDSMTPEASVNMIKVHTANGLAIAKEYGLPKEVQAAIMEHHGTMPMKYFYLKAQKYTDGELPYKGYCYDGPKPKSKISAILMLCDASEAALRSSGDKSMAEKIVNGIVNERIAFDQFSDCDITMKELDIIKSTIINTYLGIRHERVKYPDVKLTGDNK